MIKMETTYVDSISVTEETLNEEAQHISNKVGIPLETVNTVIKGIDAFYCLVGIQEVPTFEDEYGTFIKSDDEWRIFNADTDTVNESDMLIFISERCGIAEEIIESVLYEDLVYMGICQEQ